MSNFVSVDIKKTVSANKRFVAIFKRANGKERNIKFGSLIENTYIDNGDEKNKEAYLARHIVREDWYNPQSAGSLSRWILWGDSTNINKNVVDYKKGFNLI